MSGICLGDIGVMTGGASTGEPFVIVCLSAENAAAMGAGIMILPLDGSSTATVSIRNAIIHPLSPNYLPRMVVNITAEDITALSTTGVADKTLGDILTAAQSGYDISCRIVRTGIFKPSDTVTSLIPMTDFMMAEDGGGAFFNGVGAVEIWRISMVADIGDFDSTVVIINRQILG